MIKKLIGHYLINLFSILITAQAINGLKISPKIDYFLILILGFTLVHLVLKPILNIIFRPLNFLTLGLAGLIIDIGIFYAMTLYFPQLSIKPWVFPGYMINGISFPSMSFGTIMTTVIVSFVVNFIRTFLVKIYY